MESIEGGESHGEGWEKKEGEITTSSRYFVTSFLYNMEQLGVTNCSQSSQSQCVHTHTHSHKSWLLFDRFLADMWSSEQVRQDIKSENLHRETLRLHPLSQ